MLISYLDSPGAACIDGQLLVLVDGYNRAVGAHPDGFGWSADARSSLFWDDS